ncbi:alpha-tocopherol transfer protein-like [Teleopsis dalmanni]|uniref:alpha-tocopherol transfer protein-like n=1 Tax=Teleopsis dalmanni TaxID=139649 RepID=UPI0018CDD533|nr:alpha-tocopherol transfer protein-like [Teleopsis dalmanni]
MVNKSELEAKLNELQKWFQENPKLPQEIDRNLLKRFLKCMNCDIEETKKLIELNYSLRMKNPYIFLDRDPDDEAIEQVREVVDIVPMPGLTPDRCKIICSRLVEHDANKHDSIEECKFFFMLSDSRFTMNDVDTEQDSSINENNSDSDSVTELDKMADGDIQVCDATGYTLRHVYKVSISTMRMHMKFLQEAYPVRLRSLHMINCPSYMNKLIAILKPFIRDDVYKLVHFHTNGLDSLYEHVPREMLPEEFGGSAGKLEDIKAKWKEIVKEKREYLMDQKYWKMVPVQTSGRWSWFS